MGLDDLDFPSPLLPPDVENRPQFSHKPTPASCHSAAEVVVTAPVFSPVFSVRPATVHLKIW